MTILDTFTSALGLQGWFSAEAKPMASNGLASGDGTADKGPQMPAFSDAAFEDVLKQMESPDLTGFELFADTRGVQIHRRLKGTSGLYEYKVIGCQEGVDARKCALVNVDLEYRKKWDKYVSQLRKMQEFSSGLQLVYWEVAYPFPLTNRDYFYFRRTRELAFTTKSGRTQPAWVTVSASATPDTTVCPEGKAIRVTDYEQTMAITADECGKGSRLYMHSFDNPKGSIPTWLINYMAGSGASSYLDSVKKAVEGYKD